MFAEAAVEVDKVGWAGAEAAVDLGFWRVWIVLVGLSEGTCVSAEAAAGDFCCIMAGAARADSWSLDWW